MNAREVAAARRLDAFLGEAHGDAVPDDLAQRTLQRLRGVKAARPQGRLAAAAVLLGGILVVTAIAILQRGEPRAAATPEVQDPQGKSITVTTADLPPEPRVDIAAGADVVDEILRICKEVKFPVVIAGDVTGKVAKAAEQVPWREAVAALAASAAAGVEELGPVLVVQKTQSPLPYQQRLSLKAKDVEVTAFAKLLAARVGVDLVLAGDVHGRISCEFDQVSWRDALELVASRLGSSVEVCGSVLVLRQRPPESPQPERTYYSYSRMPLTTAVEVIAKMSGSNIVIGPGPWSTVSVMAKNQAALPVLCAMARAAGGECSEDDRRIYRITHRDPSLSSKPTDVTAEHIDLQTFAELARSSAQLEVLVPADTGSKLSVFATRAPFADLMAAAAFATGHKLVADAKDAAKLRFQ